MCPPVCLHTAIVNPNVQPSRPAVERSGAVARHATRVKKQRPDSGRPLLVEKMASRFGTAFPDEKNGLPIRGCISRQKKRLPDAGRHFLREKMASRCGTAFPAKIPPSRLGTTFPEGKTPVPSRGEESGRRKVGFIMKKNKQLWRNY